DHMNPQRSRKSSPLSARTYRASSSAVVAHRLLARPAVVGLARRAALYDGDPLLAPPLAGPSGNDHVGYRGVRRDRGFDFLDEDLLATRVDRHRIAAQQLNAAVGAVACAVTRNRVTHAVNHREGGCCLGGVAFIAERHVAPLR